jgi:hypothetical protein
LNCSIPTQAACAKDLASINLRFAVRRPLLACPCLSDLLDEALQVGDNAGNSVILVERLQAGEVGLSRPQRDRGSSSMGKYPNVCVLLDRKVSITSQSVPANVHFIAQEEYEGNYVFLG